MTVTERAARVKLLLLDVDGVLTDGTVVIHQLPTVVTLSPRSSTPERTHSSR